MRPLRVCIGKLKRKTTLIKHFVSMAWTSGGGGGGGVGMEGRYVVKQSYYQLLEQYRRAWSLAL